jgi:hypothetical protein
VRRHFTILGLVPLLILAAGWLLVVRQSRSRAHQLTLTIAKITTRHGTPGRETLAWTRPTVEGATNHFLTVQSATIQITNVGRQIVAIFPMYSIETNSDDLHPFRSTPLGLRGPLQPGQSCTVEAALPGVGDRPWRVGFWYSEVHPSWVNLVRSWLIRVGLCPQDQKTLEYSDWFRAAHRPDS